MMDAEAWSRRRVEIEGAIEEVRRAVSVAGNHPEYHRKVAERHRNEWPTLWNALDRLLWVSERP